MSNPIQNFYKSTITNDWSIGTGNFYVSVKPTTSVGRLVVSPSSDTLREIIEYTSTGTDSNGDYIVVSARGVGGTTEQTHTVGEKVRMNITAEDWEDMRDDIDSIVAAGAPDASTTTRGIVEIATDAEVIAGTDTGDTGAKLVATPSQLKANYGKIIPVIRTYTYSSVGSTDTRFDITNTTGTTFRYTYDGTGTNPVITAITFPIGTQVSIKSTSMTVANTGYFVVTGSGTNYFEITNAVGVAENDKTLAGGWLYKNSSISWTKPAGLKYVVVEVQAGGGGGGGADASSSNYSGGGGGGAGGYSKKLISVSSLNPSETITIGAGGTAGTGGGGDGGAGGDSSFGTHATATGGGAGKGDDSTSAGGAGGVGTGGDINLTGLSGRKGFQGTSTNLPMVGYGGIPNTNTGTYGVGGNGGHSVAGATSAGNVGEPGIVIVTEYY